jgi:hypothetical protein
MNALPFVIQNVDNQLLLKAMFALAFWSKPMNINIDFNEEVKYE